MNIIGWVLIYELVPAQMNSDDNETNNVLLFRWTERYSYTDVYTVHSTVYWYKEQNCDDHLQNIYKILSLVNKRLLNIEDQFRWWYFDEYEIMVEIWWAP